MTKKTSRTKASFEKQKRGLKAVIKGHSFEKQVGEFLSKKGYTVSFGRSIGKEKFDVFGKRYDEFDYEEYYIAECKDKARVTATDLNHFMAKLRRFYKRLPVSVLNEKPEVQGLLAYTGELPRDAHDVAEGFEVSIKFKRF